MRLHSRPIVLEGLSAGGRETYHETKPTGDLLTDFTQASSDTVPAIR